MSSQRRENRWQRTSCTERAGAAGLACPAPFARHGRAHARVGTAPPQAIIWLQAAWLATNSLQLDHLFAQLVRLVEQDIRRGSPPPGEAGRPAGPRSSLPLTPSPSVLVRLHPTLPQLPADKRRWTERYDGKRDLYLQHAA